MTTQTIAHRVTTAVTTPIGAPYHYRRNGVYYLRLRPVGSTVSHSVSLRTNDKAKAMTTSKTLRQALAGFHLDNPKADWSAIREAISEFAHEVLSMDHSGDPLQAYGMVYSDLRSELIGHAMTASMTPVQAQGVDMAIRALSGAEDRLCGNLRPLNDTLRELADPQGTSQSAHVRPSLSVNAFSIPSGLSESTSTSALNGTTFATLSTAYLNEHTENVKASTLKGLRSTLKGLAEALNDTDMTTHSRDDMTALKAALCSDKSAATVNKYLTTLVTVLDWAVNSGLIGKHYAKGLKIRKDAESDRKAFTDEQVTTVVVNSFRTRF